VLEGLWVTHDKFDVGLRVSTQGDLGWGSHLHLHIILPVGYLPSDHQLDQAVIRPLKHFLRQHRLHYVYILNPYLVKVVTIFVGGCAFCDCGGESPPYELLCHPSPLTVRVPSDDDPRALVLSKDIIHYLHYAADPSLYGLGVTWLYVHIEEV
jgi:hypothetical protein